jgi:hypothetical protein
MSLGACDYSGLCASSKYDVLIGTATLAAGLRALVVTDILGNDSTGSIPAARNAACIFEGWLGAATGAVVQAGVPAAPSQGAEYTGRLVIAGAAPNETNTLTIYATNVDGSLANASTAVVGYRLYVPKPGYY